jgi:hypothetical protein
MASNSFPVTLQEGSRVLGPVNVPTGLTAAKVTIDRTNWTNPAITLSLTIDISLDNGVTWNSPHPAVDPFPVGLTAEGGIILDKNGQVEQTTIQAVPMPQPANANRRLRATLVVAGGSIPTTVTVETS